jgi:hypothetical protein
MSDLSRSDAIVDVTSLIFTTKEQSSERNRLSAPNSRNQGLDEVRS